MPIADLDTMLDKVKERTQSDQGKVTSDGVWPEAEMIFSYENLAIVWTRIVKSGTMDIEYGPPTSSVDQIIVWTWGVHTPINPGKSQITVEANQWIIYQLPFPIDGTLQLQWTIS